MRAPFLLLPLALLSTPAIAASDASAPPTASILGTGLRVSDLERSIRFYTEVLGMSVATRLPHGTLTEIMLTFGTHAGGASIILMKDSDPAKSPPLTIGNGFEKIVIDVHDLAAVITRLKQAALPVGEVHGSMGVKVLFVTDPDGYRYELIERTPSATPKG